jgi:hypothetical protein
MRYLLTPALLLTFAGLHAAEPVSVQPKPAAPAGTTETVAKPVNTVCPVTGKAIDATIPPVEVTTGVGKDKTTTLIGVATKAAAKLLKKADEAEKALYVKAALAGKMVEKGKLVDVPAAKPAAH